MLIFYMFLRLSGTASSRTSYFINFKIAGEAENKS